MARITILAFGSLIDDPGEEISPLISDRIKGVRTPFSRVRVSYGIDSSGFVH